MNVLRIGESLALVKEINSKSKKIIWKKNIVSQLYTINTKKRLNQKSYQIALVISSKEP